MALSFISLLIILIISTWGLLIPAILNIFSNTPTSIGPEFFNRWAFVPTLLFALSLVGCQTTIKLDIRKFLAILGSAIIIGAILLIMKLPTNNGYANFGIPSIIISIIFVLLGLVPSRRLKMHTIPRSLIHLGVVLILIGTFISSSMKNDLGIQVISPGSQIKNSNIEINFGDFKLVEPFGRVYSQGDFKPEAAGIEIPVTVNNAGIVTTGVMKAYYYTLYGSVSEPYVALGLDDAYITIYVSDQLNSYLVRILEGTTLIPPHLSVNVIINPKVNLIWIGSIIMSLSILIQIFVAPRITVEPIKEKPTMRQKPSIKRT